MQCYMRVFPGNVKITFQQRSITPGSTWSRLLNVKHALLFVLSYYRTRLMQHYTGCLLIVCIKTGLVDFKIHAKFCIKSCAAAMILTSYCLVTLYW